jgi:hypothetical protein
MKTTFVAETAGIPAHFIVNEQIMQAFINHLNGNGVIVQPPQRHLTDGDGENFSLELQSGIPPKNGNQLVAEF